MKTHSIIPIFLPELACPHQCIFCNQKSITNKQEIPDIDTVNKIIEKHLRSIAKYQRTCEIAFFGGSFTALPLQTQEEYLAIAKSWIEKSKIEYIRISTRPDYIFEENLELLANYDVKIIEIGAQSMDDEVLKASGRGHTVADVINASKMINKFGFTLGIQMMVGLPGDAAKKSFKTAEEIINLNAKACRIYPLLILKNTKLAELYKAGKYKALSVNEAVKQIVPIYEIFEKNNIKIYKSGLHPSEFLHNGELLDGPWHPNFRQLVQSEIFMKKFDAFLSKNPKSIAFLIHPSDINAAIGYKKSNISRLKHLHPEFKIISDLKIKKGEFHALYN